MESEHKFMYGSRTTERHTSKSSARAAGSLPGTEPVFIGAFKVISFMECCSPENARIVRHALGLSDDKISPQQEPRFRKSIVVEAEMVAFSEALGRIDGMVLASPENSLLTDGMQSSGGLEVSSLVQPSVSVIGSRFE